MPKLKTKEQFIDDAIKKHGNKYDYSLVEYINNYTKIKIICSIHGIFEQTPCHHLEGNGCPNCNGTKKKSTEEFIIDARKVHGDKYDYSLVQYKRNNTKIKIICKKHGIFEQIPSSHLRGGNCLKCIGQHMDTEYFKEKSNKVHNNKYDYSLVSYKNCDTPIKIICPIHGEFEQKPEYHLLGRGCSKCGGSNRLTTEQFIQKSIEINGNKYDYSLVEYKNAHTKVKIICKEHGIFEQNARDHYRYCGCPICNKKSTEEFIIDAKKIHGNKYDYSLVEYKHHKIKVDIICSNHGVFKQYPSYHIQGVGCPSCNSSKGEENIKLFLLKNNLDFEHQKTFKGCKNKIRLRFDFYLINHNICIEFDGKQHFKPYDFFGGINTFNDIQKRDQIKNEYCQNNNIKLYRIRYDENINEKMDWILKKEGIDIKKYINKKLNY